MAYADLTSEERSTLKTRLDAEYAVVKAKGLALNMARGKPSSAQLDLSQAMLGLLDAPASCRAEDGTDCRNYGVLEGIPEARRLMAEIMDDRPENVLVGGNSSLTLMHDTVVRFLDFGTLGSTPWSQFDQVKWLCPVPGYDRHFAITQTFGIENIPVTMTDCGPDMDQVEALVADDPAVKGIWCVPKYSNPGGVTYSDDVVRRLAAMTTAAPDFRIMWDNAYAVHHLFDDKAHQDELLDIAQACAEAGNPDRYVKFASTSKVTLPGAGIAALAASPANVAQIKELMGISSISGDKLNQLRHGRFLVDGAGVARHMARHAALLRPKFALVQQKLSDQLASVGDCRWSNPRGGYFVSFDGPRGTAKRTVQLAKEAGVVLTGAGATWPGGIDPDDSNIRIAPTLPPLDELDQALDVFCLCVKLAALESLQANAAME